MSRLHQYLLQPSLRLVSLATSALQRRVSESPTEASTQLPDRIARLKVLHEALLREYVGVLKRVSKLPDIVRWDFGVDVKDQGEHEVAADAKWMTRSPFEPLWRNWFTWRYIVRIFVEAHIKRQLSAMASAYVFEQQVASTEMTEESRAWLQQAEGSCSKLLGALGSWQRVKIFLATLGPLLGALIIAAFGDTRDKDNLITIVRDGVVTVWQSTASLLTIEEGYDPRINPFALGYVLLYGSFLFFPLLTSFKYKRDLFFPGVNTREMSGWARRNLDKRWSKQGKELNSGTNIYRIEDQLFDLLSLAKPVEPRIDAWLQIAAAIIFTLGLAIVWGPNGGFDKYTSIIFTMVILSPLTLVILTITSMRRRRNR